MGIIVHEDLICDRCGKQIDDPTDAYRGPLQLRKLGAKGVGKIRELVLHPACLERLTRNATRV